jgi:hypothetical protein
MDLLSEVAGSDPGGTAQQTAFSVRGSHLGLAVYHIAADASFFSPHSRLWGGFGGSRNNVLTTGVRLRAGWDRHVLTVSGSMERTPFRTATSPLAVRTSTMDARWRYAFSQPVEADVMAGREWRESANANLPAVLVTADRVRFDIALSAHEEYQLRCEVRSSKTSAAGHVLGTLVMVQARKQWQMTDAFVRLSLFNFGADGTTAQVFENSLSGSNPLVPMSGTGRRVSAVLSRRFRRATAAVKGAITNHISGGLEKN